MFEMIIDGVAVDTSAFSFNSYQATVLAHGTHPYEIVDPVVIISGLPHTCAVCEASAADPDWSRYSDVPICSACFNKAEYEQDYRDAEEASLRDMLYDDGEERSWYEQDTEEYDLDELLLDQAVQEDDDPPSTTPWIDF